MPAADLRRRLSVDPCSAARLLLGAELTSRIGGSEVTVRVTEVEAYEGAEDPASHAFRGRTPRNAVMFGPAGFLYTYFVYGMHWCANVVCGIDGVASAVLIRAGEITAGLDIAQSRQPATQGAMSARPERLAQGPARLARCLGLNGASSGLDLLSVQSEVQLRVPGPPAAEVATGPRVGVAAAADWPWRFWIPGAPSVSVYRPRAPKRAAAAQSEPATQEPKTVGQTGSS